MRIALALLLCTPLLAAAPDEKRAAALEALLSARDSAKALQSAIKDARAAGVPEQSIFEARFMFLVDQRDDAGLVALLPDFDKLNASFNPGDSAIFVAREDWLATGEYLRALDALQHNDKAAFKRHITEAFWLSPRQGAAFAGHIEKLRLDEAMRAAKIDFDQPFKTINSDVPQSLKKILGGQKALLLHFWTPWSDGADSGMPDFAPTAEELGKHGIAIASIVPEASPALLKDARASIKSIGGNPPGSWIADADGKPLHHMLRITGYPTMVLVAPSGAILFNGDPADDAFWKALAAIDPAIRRPKAETP